MSKEEKELKHPARGCVIEIPILPVNRTIECAECGSEIEEEPYYFNIDTVDFLCEECKIWLEKKVYE